MIGGSMSRWADLAVGGWRLTSILTVQTGPYETPYFPSGEGDPSGTGSGLNGALGAGGISFDTSHRAQHADQLAGVSTNPMGKNRYNWTNANAFACPGDPNWAPGYNCATGNAGASVSDSSGNTICYDCEQINGAIYQVPNPIGRFGNSQVGSVAGPGLVNLSARHEQELRHHRTFASQGRRYFYKRAEPHQPGRSEYGSQLVELWPDLQYHRFGLRRRAYGPGVDAHRVLEIPGTPTCGADWLSPLRLVRLAAGHGE